MLKKSKYVGRTAFKSGHGKPVEKDREQGRRTFLVRSGGNRHPMLVQFAHQIRIVGRIGIERCTTGVMAANGVALNCYIADLAAFHFRNKLGIGQRGGGVPRPRALKKIKQRQYQEGDDHPKGDIATKITHFVSFSGGLAET